MATPVPAVPPERPASIAPTAEAAAPSPPFPTRLLTITLALVVLVTAGWLIAAGKAILVPLAVAIIVWYVLNAIAAGVHRLPIPGATERRMPGWLAMTIAWAVVIGFLVLVGQLVGDNIAKVSEAAPEYQRNLEDVARGIATTLGLPALFNLDQILRLINVGSLIGAVAGAATGLAADLVMVLVYVLFLLVEQRFFDVKLRAFFADARAEAEARSVLFRIQREMQTYLWVKTVVSIFVGGLSYLVLIIVGVDFPAFWGFIIFLLNYIPTIGSLIGIIFPAVLTLVQFGSLVTFVAVAVPLAVIQFTFGNIIEPRMMGNSLNLSPLVVMLSLIFWGTLWGTVGMFLCIPIMVMALIVLARFPQTRKLAILLSSRGNLAEESQTAGSGRVSGIR